MEFTRTIPGFVMLSLAPSAIDAQRGHVELVALNLAHVASVELFLGLPYCAKFRTVHPVGTAQTRELYYRLPTPAGADQTAAWATFGEVLAALGEAATGPAPRQ